jgi:hypothetical protein
MNFETIEKIYGKLEVISVKIEPKSIPNPHYISEKIGQCHVCIEEVEKFFIQISRELSIHQRALNNAEATYITARDELLSTDPDIISLPSSKDREARANTRLKSQFYQIKDYKNQLSDLERLFGAINVKLKNLDRQNRDIKVQLRLMESQIKLGSGNVDDFVTKDLMNEMKNTIMGKDMWEEVNTKLEQIKTMDPTKPVEAQDLDPLTYLENTVNDLISKNNNDLLIQNNSLSISSIDKNFAENIPTIITSEPVLVDEMEQPADDLTEFIKSLPENDDVLNSIESSKESEPEIPVIQIDLDKVLTLTTTGGEQKTNESKLPESDQKKTQEKPKDPNEIDFSALLSQFN